MLNAAPASTGLPAPLPLSLAIAPGMMATLFFLPPVAPEPICGCANAPLPDEPQITAHGADDAAPLAPDPPLPFMPPLPLPLPPPPPLPALPTVAAGQPDHPQARQLIAGQGAASAADMVRVMVPTLPPVLPDGAVTLAQPEGAAPFSRPLPRPDMAVPQLVEARLRAAIDSGAPIRMAVEAPELGRVRVEIAVSPPADRGAPHDPPVIRIVAATAPALDRLTAALPQMADHGAMPVLALADEAALPGDDGGRSFDASTSAAQAPPRADRFADDASGEDAPHGSAGRYDGRSADGGARSFAQQHPPHRHPPRSPLPRPLPGDVRSIASSWARTPARFA